MPRGLSIFLPDVFPFCRVFDYFSRVVDEWMNRVKMGSFLVIERIISSIGNGFFLEGLQHATRYGWCDATEVARKSSCLLSQPP
jgi:hypothetical protein